WLESTCAEGTWAPAPGYNMIGGTSVTDWLEFLAGSGIGRDSDNTTTIGNPILMAKVLVKPAEVDGSPGYAFSAGSMFNKGRGSMYGDGILYNLIGMTIYRLSQDKVNLHLNLGLRTEKERR